MHRQTFKTTLSEGGGERKHFCDADCVSIPGKEEICTHFWFVSTSFVRGCSMYCGIIVQFWTNVIKYQMLRLSISHTFFYHSLQGIPWGGGGANKTHLGHQGEGLPKHARQES